MTNQSLLSVTQADIDAVNQHARNKINFGESLAEAFARHRLNHTAPAEVVLRWEGDMLCVGGVKVGEVWRAIHQFGWVVSLDAKEVQGFAPNKAEARAAAEQSVRDWLARAGLVRQGGEPVAGREYVIRKGGYFYRPNAQGYTSSITEAGRYTLEEAINYSHPNGPEGPRDGITYHHQDAFIERLVAAHPPASPTAQDVAALVEALRRYADQFCELGPYTEACGKLEWDQCSGCLARTALAKHERTPHDD